MAEEHVARHRGAPAATAAQTNVRHVALVGIVLAVVVLALLLL